MECGGYGDWVLAAAEPPKNCGDLILFCLMPPDAIPPAINGCGLLFFFYFYFLKLQRGEKNADPQNNSASHLGSAEGAVH